MKRFWKMMLASMVMLSILFAMFPNQSYGAKPKEFRAVWVSSVYGIDYPKQATADATCLMTQADEILDGAKSLGNYFAGTPCGRFAVSVKHFSVEQISDREAGASAE